jgi:hypothetical protein
MFAMFMETRLVKKNGMTSMINMHNWMFIDSYTKLRKKIIKDKSFIILTQFGIKAFEDIGNDIVQTCSFIFRNYPVEGYQSIFIRLVDYKDYHLKEKEFFNLKNYSIIRQKLFSYSPSSIFSYWVQKEFFENYINAEYIEKFGDFTGSKNITGKNDKYVRYFWEVESEKIVTKRWVPYSKGGFYRKYYGNIIHVVDWSIKARDFYQKNKTSNLLNEEYWYRSGITYSAVTSRGTGFRYFPKGYIFDYGGPVINTTEEYTPLLLALLNSKIAEYYFHAMNPSVNLQTKDLRSLPIILPEKKIINDLAKQQIATAKQDWSEYENTLEFERNYILQYLYTYKIYSIKEAVRVKSKEYEILKKKFIDNEHKINNEFKNLYGLNTLSIVFEERDIPIRKVKIKSEIISFISFLVGVLMGRYSIIEEGLVYAGGTFDSSKYGAYDVDEDGIIPIFPDLSFENGLVHRIIGLIKDIYGEEYYRDNIDFIADALGKKANETSEETLNRYLNNDFYSDHLKTYKKRPIYWMFSSGKKNGFKALIYLHRYNSNTLAKMNAGYFQPATTVLRTRISEVEKLINTASDREKVQLERTRFSLVEQLNEAIEYGQVLDYMANKYISIDLDDGVKENYKKFQKIEINTSHGKVKKDLLIPIK